MEFTAVASSNLSGVHYDASNQVLTVEFKSGARYRCDGVPQDDYDDLMSAPSKGQFFRSSIRDSYPVTRV